MTKLEALRRIAEGLGELADFEALEGQGQLQEIDQRYLHLLLDELGEGGRFSIEERGPRVLTASAHFVGTGGTKIQRPQARPPDEVLGDLLATGNADQAHKALGAYSRDDIRSASKHLPRRGRGRPPKK